MFIYLFIYLLSFDIFLQGIVVEAATNKAWPIPQNEGKLRLTIRYLGRKPSVFDVHSDVGIDRVIQTLKNVSTEDQMIAVFEHSANSPYANFTAAQGESLYAKNFCLYTRSVWIYCDIAR